MKPGMKLAILLGGAVVVWGLIAYVFFAGNSPAKKAPEVAKTALYASVDCPESVSIVAVSKPDSVFGRDYINDDEKMAIAISEIDFENSELTSLVERQMSAMSAIRSLVSFDSDADKPRPFNGWKVKIEYEAKTADGSPYRSEYWFILDKEAQCVVNSFEIPIL